MAFQRSSDFENRSLILKFFTQKYLPNDYPMEALWRWTAPELLLRPLKIDPYFDPLRHDVYSFGMVRLLCASFFLRLTVSLQVLYELVSHRLPYDNMVRSYMI